MAESFSFRESISFCISVNEGSPQSSSDCGLVIAPLARWTVTVSAFSAWAAGSHATHSPAFGSILHLPILTAFESAEGFSEFSFGNADTTRARESFVVVVIG